MRKTALLLALLLSGFVFPQAEIVGGEDCDISEYPWQAAISISSGDGYYYSCGASVIHDYWLLTAAHCVEEGNQIANPEDVTVTLGTTYDSGSGGEEYEVEEVISHSSYSGGDNDIALLRTKELIQFNDDVQPISIICSDQVSAGAQDVGMMATITGWGNTSQGGQGSYILQYINTYSCVTHDVPRRGS